MAIESLAQMPEAPDIVVLPVGGGGLSAGMIKVLAERAPNADVYLVEPLGGASLAAAIDAGRPVALDRVDTFVDGAAVATIGALPFETLKSVPRDHVLAAPEDRICATITEVLNVEGIVLEPAGALTIDALADLREVVAGKRVLCVVSGGNFDFERLPEVKERAQRFLGLKKYFILRLPQRPGALRDFLEMLGPHDDIARFEYLKKSARNFGSVLIGIETTEPTAFPALFARMDAAGLTYRDITDDESVAQFVL